MADRVNVGKNAMSVTVTDVRTPYTKVVIECGTEEVDNETVIKQFEWPEGETNGLTLTVNCPWGTLEMAKNLYNSMCVDGTPSVRYTGYNVTSALLNPVAEIGDAVTTNGVYGGLYQQESTFGHTMYSDYSAPLDEQLNHEYKYETSTERRITRESMDTKAMFHATNTKIEAKVSKIGGDNKSFGWSLTDEAFELYSGNKKVFRASEADGVEVYGKITASSGLIGAYYDNTNKKWTGGFEIKKNYMSTKSKTAYDQNADGIFIGTSGIGLGKKKFMVNSSGELDCTGAKVKGSITCTSITCENCTVSGADVGSGIKAANITDGTLADSQLDAISGGKVTDGGGGVPKSSTSSNVQTSLGHGDTAHAAVTSTSSGSITNSSISTNSLTAANIKFGSRSLKWVYAADTSGGQIQVLGY